MGIYTPTIGLMTIPYYMEIMDPGTYGKSMGPAYHKQVALISHTI